MNGRQVGLFRSCHATLCCVTLGNSPTVSEPSIVPDTDTSHRVWETIKKKGIKPYPRERVRVLNKAYNSPSPRLSSEDLSCLTDVPSRPAMGECGWSEGKRAFLSFAPASPWKEISPLWHLLAHIHDNELVSLRSRVCVGRDPSDECRPQQGEGRQAIERRQDLVQKRLGAPCIWNGNQLCLHSTRLIKGLLHPPDLPSQSLPPSGHPNIREQKRRHDLSNSGYLPI